MPYQTIIKERNISRLCHFTKTRNLPFMLGNGEDSENGILANDFIIDKSFLEKTDKQRLDGHEDYICTSVQYPNSYYFTRVKSRMEKDLFNEWAILLIDPSVIDNTSKFCSVNAATSRGRLIKKGPAAMEELFEFEIRTTKRTLRRSLLSPPNMPTDIQAEVLIHKKIDKSHVIGVIFPSRQMAERETLRLDLCGVNLDNYNVSYSEDIFSQKLKKNLDVGIRPCEIKYEG